MPVIDRSIRNAPARAQEYSRIGTFWARGVPLLVRGSIMAASIKSECLDKMEPLGEWHLRRAVKAITGSG